MSKLSPGTRAFGIAILFSSALYLLCRFSATERTGAKARIGVPDTASALIIEYMVREKMAENLEVSQSFDVYPTKDCCTSTSEWALSSGSLAMAVMCPDAAERLIEKDPKYEIVGPCMVNSDILMVRNGRVGPPRRIAVSYGRDFQKRLVDRVFGAGTAVVPMTSSAIPYAYETHAVDGAVIDVLRAFQVEGEMVAPPAGQVDLVTYVLVVQKRFKEEPRFCQFLEGYKRALDELNQDEMLALVMRRYAQLDKTDEEVKRWKQMRVRFVLPTSHCP